MGTDDAVLVVDPDAIEAGTDALGIGSGTAPPGTYVLVFSLGSAETVTVGALGTATFSAGAYAYVGSAFGSNGLGRVDRHRRVAAGEHDVQHWHIDYFGNHSDVTLEAVVAVPHAGIECSLATEATETLGRRNTIEPVPLDGFGASDCTCSTHLVGDTDVDSLRTTVVDVADTTVREYRTITDRTKSRTENHGLCPSGQGGHKSAIAPVAVDTATVRLTRLSCESGSRRTVCRLSEAPRQETIRRPDIYNLLLM